MVELQRSCFWKDLDLSKKNSHLNPEEILLGDHNQKDKLSKPYPHPSIPHQQNCIYKLHSRCEIPNLIKIAWDL